MDDEGTPTGGGRRTAPATQRRPVSPDRPGLFARIVEFLREVRNELAKVAWPNRPEVVKYTLVVAVTLVFMTTLVFALDFAFAKGVLWLFGG